MEYNTDRSKLIIPEYGRNVQKMVNYCLSLEDRDSRNDTAKAIIEVMGNLNPHLRDVPDFKHKLWDQLFIMADFNLDVDSPYEIPERETFTKAPDILSYPKKSNRYRFYGINLRLMIEEASQREDNEEKEALIMVLANHMKKSYLNWNRDVVDDETVLKHLYELSGEKIDLRNKNITLTSSLDLQKKRKSTYTDNKGKSSYGHSRGHSQNNSQHRNRK
ncbi:MAG: DUF4290 domain-containing protein [Bacteroidota bacterium]